MAFSFGASSSSTPSLFGSSTASFGAPASTPSLFGSTPAFGASSSSLFGGSSTPAFGASSTPSLFGGSFSTPASTPSLFGSTPAFGQSTGGFSFSTSSSLFGTASAFGQSQGGFGFGQQNAAQPQGAAQGGIATTDNKQITHYTRWDEINQAGRNQLLQMEKRLADMKDESRQLEQCARLQDTQPEQPDSSEVTLRHNLKGLTSSWLGDEEEVMALNERVHELLHSTELAVRTFQRSFQWREAAKAVQGQPLQPAIRELLSAPVILPSKYLQRSAAAFEKNLEQYFAVVAELEKLLPVSASRQDWPIGNGNADTFLSSIKSAVQNVNDLLMHAASKINALTERMGAAKERHLERLRQDGDYRDPFQEAERSAAYASNGNGTTLSKSTFIPPAQQNWRGSSEGSRQALLQLTHASPSPAAGGAASAASTSLFGGQPYGGGMFGDFGQQKSATARKIKAKK